MIIQGSATQQVSVHVSKEQLLKFLKETLFKTHWEVKGADFFRIDGDRAYALTDYGHHRGGRCEEELKLTPDEFKKLQAFEIIRNSLND